MRRVDVPLWYIVDIVATCIVQHNMYAIEKDKFDKDRSNRDQIKKMNRKYVIEKKKK